MTSTREQFIETMSLLLRIHGYYGSGLNEVVRMSGAPKGSLYHHFPEGKEQLAAEAVTQAAALAAERIDACMARADDPAEGLRTLLEEVAARTQEANYRTGSPIAAVAMETAGQSGILAGACERGYSLWEEHLSKALLGHGLPQDEAARLATAIVALIEGSLVLSRTKRSLAPLALAGELLAELVEASLRETQNRLLPSAHEMAVVQEERRQPLPPKPELAAITPEPAEPKTWQPSEEPVTLRLEESRPEDDIPQALLYSRERARPTSPVAAPPERLDTLAQESDEAGLQYREQATVAPVEVEPARETSSPGPGHERRRPPRNLTIFGASGRVGSRLVEQALAAGYVVTAFVQSADRMWVRHERLRVVQGDIRDAERVLEAVRGSDAVLSALGAPQGDTDDTLTEGMHNIVEAMRLCGITRLIALTGIEVTSTRDEPSPTRNLMLKMMRTFSARSLRDAEGMVQAIRSSELQWTIVRAPKLTNHRRSGQYRVGYLQLGPGSSISRADVADFMLSQLFDDAYLCQMPMISR